VPARSGIGAAPPAKADISMKPRPKGPEGWGAAAAGLSSAARAGKTERGGVMTAKKEASVSGPRRAITAARPEAAAPATGPAGAVAPAGWPGGGTVRSGGGTGR
jgi:hypothetical protein